MPSFLERHTTRRPRSPRVGPLALVLALVALPAAALTGLPGWFDQWTGGAPLMASGESIGSLPCYLTPAEQIDLPGADEEQNELQELPALQLEVPYTIVFGAVDAAAGEGYAFVGPAPDPNGARLRLFGDLAATVDRTHLEGRDRRLSWSIGPQFAGSTLVVVAGGKVSTGLLPAQLKSITLPVESAFWQASFASGSVTVALVRADGALALLELDEKDGDVVVVQSVP